MSPFLVLPRPQAAFENRFGQEQTEAAEVKLFGDFAHNLNSVENDESRQAWVEDMDLDKPDPRVSAAVFNVFAVLLPPRRAAAVGRRAGGRCALQAAAQGHSACPAANCVQLASAVFAPLCVNLPPRPLQELRTPTKDRVVSEKRSPIHGVVLGATDRSYLLRDNQVRARWLVWQPCWVLTVHKLGGGCSRCSTRPMQYCPFWHAAATLALGLMQPVCRLM